MPAECDQARVQAAATALSEAYVGTPVLQLYSPQDWATYLAVAWPPYVLRGRPWLTCLASALGGRGVLLLRAG